MFWNEQQNVDRAHFVQNDIHLTKQSASLLEVLVISIAMKMNDVVTKQLRVDHEFDR